MRKERPYPGAQLRFTDADGHRLTCFATNTAGEAIATLELRHRQRAQAEDRSRAARVTGLRDLPSTTPRRTKTRQRRTPLRTARPRSSVEVGRETSGLEMSDFVAGRA
ncbi:hypothetical protein J2Z21_008699 [Streptomyces griseochromogenes]|uniref:Uncharacterized protein n=1 Tax=Streptomyces griseochromogenes TaxID=68214 RepID=A0ABS4M7Q8_9ACTN|nr:hypothetical protein [Streptomyces griseochromogenes]